MPKFSYIASTNKGDSVRGSLEASNKNDVAKQLSHQGLFLVSCRIEDMAGHGAAASTDMAVFAARTMSSAPSATPSPYTAPPNSSAHANAGTAQPNFHRFWENMTQKQDTKNPTKRPRGKVSLKELVVLTRQLSISINAGMSFVEALQSLAQNNKNPVLSFVLKRVLDDVLSGKKFSEALAQHPDLFQTFYVSMAAAGEAGGFMPDALNRIAEFLEKEMELQSKIKSAMIYPLVIGAVATVVVTGMMAYIVPTFVRVFKEMNAPLPTPTKLLIAASDFTRNGGFLCPVLLVGLYFLMKRLRDKNEHFRTFYDEKALKIPLFGKIITLEIITRFIRTLASLADNGVAILLSLSVARQVVGNRTIEKIVDEIYASVQQGNGISPVLYKSPHFPVLVANMVATGEKTGTIPEVLLKMANYYDAEVASAVRDLLTLMEPLLIVVMAIIVGFVVAGLMLPTFSMSGLVQG
jgi:type IV pilus assembly protein PilC